MATHSSILAWKIPGTEEPSGLPSMGLCRVGQDRSNLAAAAASIGRCYCQLYLLIKIVNFIRPGSTLIKLFVFHETYFGRSYVNLYSEDYI